jgi:hypothetical protein
MSKDGEDHINIYSKGETILGRYLSNFTEQKFKDPYCGEFQSIEGYWYYNLTGDSNLKNYSGYKAKKYGQDQLKKIERNEWAVNKQRIKIALLCKLTQGNTFRLNDFIKSTLPFKHYYKYGDKIVEPKEGKWITDFFEDLRRILQNE